MLIIAGVGYRTLFRLAFESRFFGAWERMKKITGRERGSPHREGDGRVPLASARLEGVTTRYVKGVHGGLPNLPAVSNGVFRWLTEHEPELPDTVDQALGLHMSFDAASPAPALDGSGAARSGRDSEEPGVLEPEPDPEELRRLRDRLEAGELGEFTRVKLM
jgi:hypothetical protein